MSQWEPCRRLSRAALDPRRNQSWNGTSRFFDSDRCDYVFVLVAAGRRWLIPAAEITARHSIIVGGAAYGRFEVEPGRPFADEVRDPHLDEVAAA